MFFYLHCDQPFYSIPLSFYMLNRKRTKNYKTLRMIYLTKFKNLYIITFKKKINRENKNEGKLKFVQSNFKKLFSAYIYITMKKKK